MPNFHEDAAKRFDERGDDLLSGVSTDLPADPPRDPSRYRAPVPAANVEATGLRLRRTVRVQVRTGTKSSLVAATNISELARSRTRSVDLTRTACGACLWSMTSARPLRAPPNSSGHRLSALVPLFAENWQPAQRECRWRTHEGPRTGGPCRVELVMAVVV
jgi:hypothetical protein